jgi:hypothetical protein
MNNDGFVVWYKANITKVFKYAIAGKSQDAGLFPGGNDVIVGDPWVVYDRPSHRWVVTAMVFGSVVPAIYVAVSQPDDPRLDWTVRELVQGNGFLHDQPKFALTADKLVIAWTDYGWNEDESRYSTYLGGQWAAFKRSDILSGSAGRLAGSGLSENPCKGNPYPVRGDGSQSIAYVVATVYPDADRACNRGPISHVDPAPTGLQGNDLKIDVVQGLPPSLKIRQYDLAVTPYSAPPGADVSKTNAPDAFDTGDTRILSAVAGSSSIWAAANGACKQKTLAGGPADATPPPSKGCFRLFHVAISRPVHILPDNNIANVDRNLLFPALTIGKGGAIFAAVQESFDKLDLAAAVFGLFPNHPDEWQLLTYAKGVGTINCPDQNDYNLTRIGDYSGADSDPSDPNVVWLALEIASGSGCDQGSAIAKIIVH